jgi:hypothetical protein
VTPSDLAFILKQIKIAEAHSAVLADLGAGPSTDPVRCQAMIGTGPNQIESPLVSFGLRTVDGSCNNLQPGQATYGAADQTFPRLTEPAFRPAEDATAFGGSPTSSYAQTTGAVVDSEPRTISNLIVDQTSTNPAAVAAAEFPVRSQGNEGVKVCTTPPTTPGGNDGLPAGCVPEHQTLDIPNVTTDVGLSPPYNSLFTIFGQFFDHGLDKITNGGSGTVFVPVKADDPLVTHGPDGIAGTNCGTPTASHCDEVAAGTPMVLTRGTIKNAPNGVRNAPNTDTPFVDQSQTYTSHSSHQVFLREYVDTAGRPVSTGKFLSTPDGQGLATWTMIKAQARTSLGLELVDADVTNIPMIAADPYGNFIPGPARGLPQYVTTDVFTDANGVIRPVLVEGNRTTPAVRPPANVVRIGTAFLNDIAHSADPGSLSSPKTPDANNTAGSSLDAVASGQYDDELLGIHAICGDGRCNENIALQAIHQVFHDEHDRLIGDIKNTLTNDTSTGAAAALAEWKLAAGADGWNGERLFQAARFVTEMQYQHLVFEEFARKVQPAINPFEPFAFTQSDVDPAITAEFAHAVYRFGHSMLTDTIPRVNTPASVAAGAPLHNDIKLLDGFLNPAAFYNGGGGQTLGSQDAAGSIIMGLSDQVGQELDEFVVNTLRNNLLGLPLDLPAINMARARSEGIPPLNDVRRQIFAATNDGQLTPYTDWIDFGQQLKHPESLINFVAAYGTHPTITGTLAQRRAAAKLIVDPGTGQVQPFDAADFMFGTNHDETADNTAAVAAVPADPGSDGAFGTGCGTPDATPECAGDVAAVDAVPEGPGPDGLLTAVNDPATNWANVGGKTKTGVDNIDLWVGGLAERTNLFGGLLGSTFNYVFENQLTNLQNGDRLYYLARTPGMNLRAQLEGNSFSELVMRNTPAHTLKADPFATADCKFELDNITWPATTVGTSGKLITGTGSVQDDPKSECDENEQLLRMADGTIRYRTINTAMPSGINAQAVYNGKTGAVNDRIWGGADNDTFWGGPGKDVIEGGDGADIALGGEGNDIITDLAGDDVPKGGPGNDAIDGGAGLDIIMAGDGNDFTNGGANTNETFGGSGDDFSIAGQGLDAIFGDSGNDWEEGGDQPDLLIGDSSSFFFDDHNVPGHDILIGQGGDDDYDMEGGDDIGVAGPGVEKVAGAAGFDWEIGLGDPQAQDTDLAQVFVAGGVILPGVRDKFNEVESLSGGILNDTLRGDDVVPTAVGGGGFVGCDALDAAGVARITGLNLLVTDDMRNGTTGANAADVIAATSTHQCLLEGRVWGAGNILLGGGGNDLIEGRGADDIIDGDRYINVRLSVRTNPADPASEIGTTDLMENKAKLGNFGTGTAGMTLQQAVFAGLVDPGNIVSVREILTSTTPDTDVALFSDVRTNYDITVADVAGEKVITVNHTGGTATDGIDTVRNVETLRFAGGLDVATSTLIAPAPAVTLSTTTLAFASRNTGTTTTLPVVVTNDGTATLNISGATIAAGSAFSVSNNGCTAPVAPAGTCTIQVAFTPTAVGVQTANLSIASDAAGSPTTVALSGTGLAAPAASVNPTTLAFGTRTTGTTTPLTATVTNTGTANLVVTGATIAPAGLGFTVGANGCGTVLPGASCTITVNFAPTTVGARTAALSIAHNAGTALSVTLTGTGQAPVVTAPTLVTPATVAFGTRRLNTNTTQNVRLSNSGPGVINLSAAGLSTSAPFSVTMGNCPTALAAGRSCNLSVTFRPTAVGSVTTSLTVTSNAAGSPRVITLTGTGRN